MDKMPQRVVAKFLLADRIATRFSEDGPDKLVALFDSLRPKQKISVAMKSIMGMSKVTDGTPHDWLVGRRSKGRNYETITLLPVDGETPNKFNTYKLWKRPNRDGVLRISGSHGDMAVSLISVNGISTK